VVLIENSDTPAKTTLIGEEQVHAVRVRIAGEIASSSSPGLAMKKWRMLFGERQRDVARVMGVSPSVLSDYEKGKRSPGIQFVRKFVESLIALDVAKGGANIRHYSELGVMRHKAILDIREFLGPIPLRRLVEALDGVFLWGEHLNKSEIYGYTVIDSIAAIRYMDSTEYIQLFGLTSMRLIIFTNVSTGRSPLVAVRVYPLKPLAVALHGLASQENVDKLAVELAELSNIPLIVSKKGSVKEVIDSLQGVE
jgi:putative transcriptional regulator